MAIIRRWEPFREIETIQREMNRLFDRLMAPTKTEELGEFIPAAEMHETPDALHLKVEVPGIDPKDLNVQVTAESVSISGERKFESKTEEAGFTRSEFQYGKFQRVIPLPVRIQNDKVSAEYKNGILNITLPKAESEQTKVVKINLS
ncbi:MAG: Hsp20/alpha crystallin family protein [Oscillatoriaceae bacterium SKW80]|nr:Hsp20/alpha crystallin family protein [Oscillatoriaceae bacterium SKYG93]MCX8120359.1 Hsp20/alpha crystallin family protein [Oscillatoriaceae bacterium SKW80]MDW8453285.1 Hsp20/alpha crystallin family protein [Oscillatoriaceae cyanobacterium SKYGB_i_bin93]HIK27273.1 Hsp20/alpha crystallin family protein [Oscillatoriaceae cyanobacterium M7585_C2015_266]